MKTIYFVSSLCWHLKSISLSLLVSTYSIVTEFAKKHVLLGCCFDIQVPPAFILVRLKHQSYLLQLYGFCIAWIDWVKQTSLLFCLSVHPSVCPSVSYTGRPHTCSLEHACYSKRQYHLFVVLQGQSQVGEGELLDIFVLKTTYCVLWLILFYLMGYPQSVSSFALRQPGVILLPFPSFDT